MKKIIFLTVVLFLAVKVFAWDGMPTPQLHVEGNKLKDPTGKNVVLHGWMQPTSNWFNGAGKWYNDPTNWNSTANIAPFMNYLENAATVFTDTTAKYDQKHGWYTSFVRLNTDAIGGWTSEGGLVDTSQFNGWIKNFIVPYANFLSTRGLYLVISAVGPINTPDNGMNNAGVVEQARLRKFWSTVAGFPGVKNANNIMFELMNEPVNIESSPGNGDWGNHQDKYFSAFTKWMQPVIDDIRNTGSNNIVWVPTLEWEGSPYQWAKYPFTGANIGVACHFYPSYGGVWDNATAVQNLWNLQYKPAADKWPMIITEMFWTPYPDDPYNLVNGSTAGFGNAIKKAIDNQGNVSYIVGFIGDLLDNLIDSKPSDCSLSPSEGAPAYFTWLPGYESAGPDDGTPTYIYSYVEQDNPKVIKLGISHSVKEVRCCYTGFSVKVNNAIINLDSIGMSSGNEFNLYLSNSIQINDDVKVSYSNGDVVSGYDKNMPNFTDNGVENLLKGTSPRLIKLFTNTTGDTIIAKFNKKMLLPNDFVGISLKADYNGNKDIQINKCDLQSNDSTSLTFTFSERVYADYLLHLSYSGNSVFSADSSNLNTFTDVVVENDSKGLPVVMSSGQLATNGTTVILTFTKPIALTPSQASCFYLRVKGVTVTFKDFYIFNNTIRFNLINDLHSDDVATITYLPGKITAVDLGDLASISNYQLTNLTMPSNWVTIPNRIQAENYSQQSGIQTENTSDVGGGLDVGWIDNSDWLEYATNNTSTTTSFKISFRVASPNSTGMLSYYLDNKLIKQLSVPNTGGWQTWQSLTDNITISSGKHYLKMVASTGGYNINYIDISSVATGIEQLTDEKTTIYPNPVLEEITINSADIKYNKVEIIDMRGNIVYLKQVSDFTSLLKIPVNLPAGLYSIKISNDKEFVIKRIIVKHN